MATIDELRDAWMIAEGRVVEAYKALYAAYQASPEVQELEAAKAAEKNAKEAFAKALRGELTESE